MHEQACTELPVIASFRDWNNSCKHSGHMQAVIVEGLLCLSMRVIYLTISDGNFLLSSQPLFLSVIMSQHSPTGLLKLI